MTAQKKKTGGLAGVPAGQTSIATVGAAGKGLNYRGYSIHDLAEHSTFEEVAFLLLQNGNSTPPMDGFHTSQNTDGTKPKMVVVKLKPKGGRTFFLEE